MATVTAQIVAALEAAILANPLTVSVNVDGQAVTFGSLSERDAYYDSWKSRLAREQGTRPRLASINLGNG